MNKQRLKPRLILALLFLQTSAFAFAADDFTLALKGRGSEALAAAETRAASGDAFAAETGLFRINELANDASLLPKAIDALGRLESKPMFREPQVKRRLGFIKQKLLLRTGRLPDAEAVRDGLNFLAFDIMGPFPQNDTDAAFDTVNDRLDAGQAKGKTYTVTRFSPPQGKDGAVSVNELLPEEDIAASSFYFRGKFRAAQSGIYRLFIGKTGSCRIWVNDIIAFENNDNHGFCHGQYFADVYAPAGEHTVTITAAASPAAGLKVSCAVDFISAAKGPERAQKQGSGVFPSLKAAIQDAGKSEEAAFWAGYLIYAASMNPDTASLTQRFCERVSPTNGRYAAAQYYAAMAASSYETADAHLQKSAAAMEDNAAAILASAGISIRSGFLYKAWEQLNLPQAGYISEKDRLSALTKFYLAKGWHAEARKTADKLASINRLLYLDNSAIVCEAAGEYAAAADKLGELFAADIGNRSVFRRLKSTLDKSGRMSEALALCGQAAAARPADVSLLLAAAKYAETLRSPENALPWLAAGLKRSPYNSKLLAAIGHVYRKLNRKGAAAFYYREAIKRAPADHELRQYVRFAENTDDAFAGRAWEGSISELAAAAEKHRDADAVYLLREQTYHVNRDASYEKRVRTIVKIYSDEAAAEFARQYVVYEPETEAVENLRCRILNGDETINATNIHVSSLSDPESRLYYNLNAISIQATGITKGSVLDFSYTIKNSGGVEYRNSFGQTLAAGGTRPTLLYKASLSCPNAAPIHVFTKDINPDIISKEQKGGNLLYSINLADLPACRREKAMPPLAELLPAVYFTSFASWDELADWYRLLLKDRIVMSAEMRSALEAMQLQEASDEEKISRIYDHVTGAIRYVGFELGMGALQPRSTDATYASRMGDCKDIAAVLAAFLREAGIEADIALVATRSKGAVNLNVPALGQFNHAVCYARALSGVFLDGTANRAAWHELPAGDRGVQALVIGDRASGFALVDGNIYSPNADDVITHITINGTEAQITRTLSKQGIFAPAARSELNDASKKQKSLNEYWNSLFPGAIAGAINRITADINKPVTYTYNVFLPNYATKLKDGEDDELIFSPFPTATGLFRYAMNSTRTHSILLGGKRSSKETITIALPKGFEPVNLRQNRQITSQVLHAAYAYSYAQGVVTITRTYNVSGYVCEASAYDKFRQAVRAMQQEENAKLIIRRSSKAFKTE